MYKKITPDLLRKFFTKLNLVFLMIIPLLLAVNAANATKVVQATIIKISGTVTDSKDQPLPGVTVLDKATKRGTATDANGKYTIEVNTGSTLVFSFIGFKRQEIVVTNQPLINVKMTEESNILPEVVAIGYQTGRKS